MIIIRWIYGPNNLANAALFLKECLRLDGKIEVSIMNIEF